jgi:SHS2 domain-containing protein
MRFEHFDHGADVGVRGFGATPEEAFEGAASALFSLVAEDLASVRNESTEMLTCAAPDLAELLVAFLNELISLSDVRRLVFGRFEVAIEHRGERDLHLAAWAFGERYDPLRHRSTVEPKGATFTALEVSRGPDGWLAQCVVDV